MFPLKTPLFRKLSHSTLSTLTASIFHPPNLSKLADECSSFTQIQQIHAQMIVSARIHDNFAASRLLSFCALSSSGNLSYAIRIFNNTQQPNSFMWNTLIRAQADSSNPIQGFILYMKMQRMGVLPGKHTFPFVLKACSKLRSVKCCVQVHTHVVKYGLDCDLHVLNGLIRGYSVPGDLGGARKVFDDVPVRSLSIWTTMICGYAQNHCADEALVLFDQMVGDEVEPNGATLASVLSACGQSGCLDFGEKVRVYMEERGIEVGVILGTALVNMYAKNGAILLAWKCFDGMLEKNIATWNAMICGLAAHGYAKEAIDLFGELKKEHVVPNDITFVGVLSACCHAGLLDLGREMFELMNKVYGIEPRIEHYGCLVNLLGRGGKLMEAEEVIRRMRCKADVMIWGALLSACKNHGNIEIAERVVKEILALDPHNHGVYVVLSNMYAEVGQWTDVSRLRKVMKEESLNKTPGLSLISGDD